MIAILSVLTSGAPAVLAFDGLDGPPRDSRSHSPSLSAGHPLYVLEGIRAQQTPTPEDDIPDVSLTLGGASQTVDVAGYFSDSVHGYGVTASPNGVVRTSRSGTVITLEPLAAGSATVTVRGRKLGGSERKRFTVTVTAMLAAPTATGSIAAVTLIEGDTHVVTASDHFGGAGITYAATSSDTGAATVEVDGAEVTVTAVGAGSATITVTATNSGGSAQQAFAVTVVPPAPVAVGSVEALTLTRGAKHVEDASKYFEGEGLTYTAESSGTEVATVEVEDATATVTAVAAGEATVTVTATNAGGSASQSFAVAVQLPAVTLTRGDTRTLDLSDHFGDDATGYDAAVSPAGIVGLDLSGSQLTLTALANGEATVTLEVTTAGGTAEHRFVVTVLPPAPTAVGSITAVTITEGKRHVEDASNYFSGEGITYTAASSNAAVAAVAVEGATVTVTAVAAGEATVTATATNAGGSAGQSFAVTVELPSITLTEGGTRTIELADYFGADVTGYEVTVAPSGVVHVSRSGSQLTLSGLAAGEATVTATATSAGGNAEQSFVVTVSAAASAPTAVGSIAAVTITEGETHAEDASAYFEGEGLTYAAESSDEAVATVEVAGASVTVTAVAAGESTVTVTATNGGGSAQQSFVVTVVPPAPTAAGSIADAVLRENESAREVELGNYFAGAVERYDVAAEPAGIVHLWESEGRLALTPLASGLATVTVTATNAGGVARQAFLVTVRDGAPRALGTVPLARIIEGDYSLVDAAAHFDGDSLTFAAASSSPHVVAAEAYGGTVVVTARAVGVGLVTVTATNGAGSATQEIVVVVTRRAPRVTEEFGDLLLTAGTAARTIDLSSYFHGDSVRYGASADPAGVVHLWESDGWLTLAALAAGSATVTVWSANSGGMAAQTFEVTVGPRAPRALASRTLLTLSMGGPPLRIELANYFGGAVERSEAAATPRGVVHLWESDGALTATPLAAGSATVRVTALNPAAAPNRPSRSWCNPPRRGRSAGSSALHSPWAGPDRRSRSRTTSSGTSPASRWRRGPAACCISGTLAGG